VLKIYFAILKLHFGLFRPVFITN